MDSEAYFRCVRVCEIATVCSAFVISARPRLNAERLFGPEVFTEAVSGFESGDSLLGYSPLG